MITSDAYKGQRVREMARFSGSKSSRGVVKEVLREGKMVVELDNNEGLVTVDASDWFEGE